MKPLYVKKNGVVSKVSGIAMPDTYPSEKVAYDNTDSGLQATDVQDAIDEIVDGLGTGASKDIPASGDAGNNELVLGNDSRLSDAREASDVYSWAKAETKPTYTASEVGAIATTAKGAANGVAELDANGYVLSSQLPSYVDDIIEVADYDHLPITGESGKIYVTLDTNLTYRWSGSGYTEVSPSLALGETSSTAYRGDRGKTAYDHSQDTGRITAAVSSGLYKFSATAQGHISGTSAVQKSDITALGIPAQDTIIKNTAYGTCSTAGDVKDKVATLSNATNWVLEVGTIVGIRFTYTNTFAMSSGNKVTLNVNNTGAKVIRYSDDTWTGSMDIKCPTAYGEAGQTIYYMYDGTYWVWVGHSKDNNTLYNFVGREFRSCDWNDAGLGTGFGGDANLMVVNGVYYYNSNGPSTSIGASADDGSVFVHTCDDGYVVQIAQNYETGNIFVRAMNNSTWGNWKKPIANIAGNNAVLTTDKTPFLTRQTLNPTGFSGYVREKLVGASYAWNQLCENGDFSNDTQGWTFNSISGSVSSNICTLTLTATGDNYADRVCYQGIAGHKYLVVAKVKPSSSNKGSFALRTYYNGTGNYADYVFQNNNTWQFGMIIIAETTGGLNNRIRIRDGSYNQVAPVIGDNANVTCCMVIDLTLAFGSTIADYLYSLTNNAAITKLRDMGCPIDSYTAYGNYLVSSKTSGKKITFKNLVDYKDFVIGSISGTGEDNNTSTIRLRSPFIRVAPNTTYAFSTGNSLYVYEIHEYVAEGNWIKYTPINATSGTLTVSANTNLVKVLVRKQDNSPIYVNDNPTFQMEKGLQATAYTPYAPVTYSLGNDELRGKFDLVNGEIVASGDVKESNGEIDRNWGIVDLGTLTWYYRTEQSVSGLGVFSTTMPNTYKKGGSVGFICGGGYCANGLVGALADMANKQNKDICLLQSNGTNYMAYARNTAYSDGNAFKASLDGVYMYFELETPTTEQSTPFADPMSMVGATTEEYIDDRDIPCPVGAERQYMGQSEDVVEIPSSPLSDGDSVLHCQTSGGKSQLYWEDITSLIKWKLASSGTIAVQKAKTEIMLVGKGVVNSNIPVGLSLIIPKASLGSSGRYWQIGDTYNNTTSFHLQAIVASNAVGTFALYYGADEIPNATYEWYYR